MTQKSLVCLHTGQNIFLQENPTVCNGQVLTCASNAAQQDVVVISDSASSEDKDSISEEVRADPLSWVFTSTTCVFLVFTYVLSFYTVPFLENESIISGMCHTVIWDVQYSNIRV